MPLRRVCAKSAAWQFGLPQCEGTAQTELYPMPLPYPEVFWRKTAEEDKKLSKKKAVVCVVIALNFLYSNRPRECNLGEDTRRQLSRKHWEAVRRLEQFIDAWIEVSPITAQVMGRTAGKVESLEETLAELEKSVCSLAKTGGNYFTEKRPVSHGVPDSGKDAEKFGAQRCGEVWSPKQQHEHLQTSGCWKIVFSRKTEF